MEETYNNALNGNVHCIADSISVKFWLKYFTESMPRENFWQNSFKSEAFHTDSSLLDM